MNVIAHVAEIPAWNVEPFSNRLFLKDVVKIYIMWRIFSFFYS